MQKIYMGSMSRFGDIIKFFLLVVVILGMGGKVCGQVAGDFETKNSTGNWSDYNSWNRYNGTVFIPATIGQIPSLTNSVYIRSSKTITVDVTNAECNNLNFATTSTCLVSWNLNCILNVYGNLNFGSTTGPSFSTWPTSAKLVIKGSGIQTIVNQNPNHRFIHLEIDKAGGSFSFTSQDVGFEKLTLTSGATVVSTGYLIGSPTATININGGIWTQVMGANRINGGAAGTDLLALNVKGGEMTLASTSSTGGYNFGSISVTDGGTLNLNNTINNINITNSFNVDGTSTLNTALANTPSALSTSFLGTVNYNHTGNQSIISTSYGNLGLLVSGTKSTSATLNITKSLIIGGSALLPLSSTIGVNIGGDWTSWGQAGLTESQSTVDFNGVGPQSINTTGGENFFLVKKSGLGTLTLNSNVATAGGGAAGLNISSGILDAGTNTLSGTAGTTLTMSGGKLKLAKLTTLPEFTGTYALSGGTIELYGAGAQVLKGGEAYRNLTFSNSTNTTLSSNPASIIGTVYITGSSLLDIGSSNGFGDINTNLTMDGGRFKMAGSSTSKPDIDGTFNLTGGVIQFDNVSASTRQTIKGKNGAATPVDIVYNQIEVTGSNVGQSNSDIIINSAGGKFSILGTSTSLPAVMYMSNRSIKSSGMTNTSSVLINGFGTMVTTADKGFSGFATSFGSNSSIQSNISSSNITLNAGSNVNYGGSADQEISNQIPYQNLTLSSTGAKNTINSPLTILGNFNRSGTHIFNEGTGRVIFAGSALQTYTAASGTQPIEFYNVSNTNTVGLQLDSTIGIQNELNLTSAAKLNLNIGDINMRSTASRTSFITDLGTTAASTNISYVSGRFSIERYLKPRSSWRLLATPVDIASSPSISASWREGEAIGVNTATGFGTRITGPVGMDEVTKRPSMKSYDGTVNDYVEINTATKLANPIANNEGYYIFVRGDRGVAVGGLGSTNLRIKGKIRTGDQTFTVPAYTGTSAGFISFGNPYPSAIDFRTIFNSSIAQSYIVWNPDSIGSSGVGKFETYIYNSGSLHFQKTPGNTIRDSIQSGEAVFIQSLTAGSITVKESDKVGGSRVVSRTGENEGHPSATNPTLEINLRAVASDGTSFLSDGVLVNFGNNYSNAIDNMDVRKIANSTDNLAIQKSSIKLVVERRSTPEAKDTIFLSLTNSRVAAYRFEIDPSVLGNLPLNAFLVDKFLATETPVSLSDVTNVPFSITSDASSRIADRFMIVFKQAAAGPLPVSFTTIAAEKNADKTNTVKWSSANEISVRSYDVERSADGSRFTAIGATAASRNNGNSAAYSFVDVAPLALLNYYRIKAMSANGQIQYSSIVKVVNNNGKAFFAVQPNPVVDKMMNIHFDNIQGSYTLKLLSKQGATVLSKKITVSSEVKNISVGNIAAGVYDMLLFDAKGKQLSQTIFIQ